jgi:glycosyltransferase involved in cell wall biosynthesis
MITVFTPSFADDNNTNAQNLTVKEVVARLDSNRFRVVMLGASSPDSRIAARSNTRILPWRRHGNTFATLWDLLTNVPDVYFFPREGQLDAAFLAARRTFGLKTALVTYVISGGLLNDNRPLLFRSIHEADAVAGNSLHMTEVATKLGGHNVQTVYDGIDRRYYFPNPSQRSSETTKRVLFAGSFRRYKRADLVIQQAARFPEWQFRLAGKGEEEDACRKLAQASNCKNVQFLGHLYAAQLGEEMRQAEIFFFPSEVEGHPQVLGQAAACGLPCVARSSYQPDYVVDGVTGLLVDSEDQLGPALARLIGDCDLRSRMSTAAIEHSREFDWDRVTEQWAEIMEQAVAHRRNHRHKPTS